MLHKINGSGLLQMTLVGLNCCPCRTCPNFLISILTSCMAVASLDTSPTIDVSVIGCDRRKCPD